jgi:hypothetical protein
VAATAVYARLAAIPLGRNVQNDNPPAFSNIAATTSAFTITGGGMYGATVKASTYGTVGLQILGPDDTTWLAVTMQSGVATTDPAYITAFAADGYGTCYLTPGRYRWVIA